MERYTLISFLTVLVAITQPVLSEQFHADKFVNEKCTGCHDSSVYTRPNRRVDSLPRLKSQVEMCDAQLGIKLFNEDVDAIVKYLNDNYYHFEK